MATLTASVPWSNTTGTIFKQWAMAVSNAFSTLGWVQTADSGQVNWSTQTVAPGVNANVFECWRTNDALSSTAPIVVKVVYGTGGVASFPALSLIVGFGSTFAAATSTITMFSSYYNSNSASNFTCEFAGDASRIHFVMWRASGGTGVWSIERSKNSSGADTGDYLVALTGGYLPYNTSSSTSVTFHPQQQILFAPSNSIYGTSSPTIASEPDWITLQTQAATAISNNTMNFGAVFPYIGGAGFGNPVLGALCIKSADMADDLQFTATLYGNSHNYLTVNTPFNSATVSRSNTTGNAIAIRFE